jgi:hypothetical protein
VYMNGHSARPSDTNGGGHGAHPHRNRDGNGVGGTPKTQRSGSQRRPPEGSGVRTPRRPGASQRMRGNGNAAGNGNGNGNGSGGGQRVQPPAGAEVIQVSDDSDG